ncbi:D-serine ammonia-lyase [Variovorax arabinosiphilus]|uniref:D-serine ammonia-lyase n=1 Tax=Variovorax arabinosiphilus TaxID=3053498 RepID=UPI002576172D|nr:MULTISPECIES: D-serine ammonia-lyase [unclassified Variovorax]MDM0119450.1 D-serine ammonia-lyase [Variovorax sp. J2L1-78]MDM0129876.1 D-serine ammonia-lyase [Variovorax sp. J2L1-63]MDM0232338.1 D-serine ammonia-lyase [Variovorax sp. J2R1-6]
MNDDNTLGGRSAAEWRNAIPLIDDLVALKELSWFNPGIAPTAQALADVGLDASDVAAASARLQRFAPWIARVFPETQPAGGLIESGIVALPAMQAVLCRDAGIAPQGALWLKKDSHLPISGSIKARGGIYEVLAHAERLALATGLLHEDDDYARLDSDAFRAFFGQHRIAVGSTGNLGLSIGLMGAKLGFHVTVHMSADARAWKKARLRANGVHVVEYASDYSAAVAEGRRQAEADPQCHFVDDENSTDLFLGYAVAAERLQKQLVAEGLAVDAEHPLFVYLPCGVGGGPGGVAFGLKLIFGDAVHCVFAEPTHAPCMLLGVRTGLHEDVSVQDFGIDGVTAADGLAVGRPSGFVGRAMQRLIDGYITVGDDTLYRRIAQMDALEGVQLEPSAVAGLPGMVQVLTETQGYRQRMGLSEARMGRATHLVWATGGGMVPEDEMARYLAQGRALA